VRRTSGGASREAPAAAAAVHASVDGSSVRERACQLFTSIAFHVRVRVASNALTRCTVDTLDVRSFNHRVHKRQSQRCDVVSADTGYWESTAASLSAR